MCLSVQYVTLDLEVIGSIHTPIGAIKISMRKFCSLIRSCMALLAKIVISSVHKISHLSIEPVAYN